MRQFLFITISEMKNGFLLNAFVWPVVDHHIIALVQCKWAGAYCLSD